MDSTTIESKVAEVIKQVAEEKTLQETRELMSNLTAEQSERDEELNGLLGKLDDQIKAEKAAERDAERKATIAKAEEKFVKEDYERAQDQYYMSMFK